MSLSANLLAALRKPGPKVGILVEVDLPDSTTLRIGRKAFSAVSRGHYEERIVSAGTLRQSLDLVRCSLQTPELRIEVDDSDKWWTGKAATYGGALYNSTVRLYVASKVAPADWDLELTGRLISWPTAGNTATLAVRPLDARLEAPLLFPRIREDDWSDADAGVWGQTVGFPYGRVSDRGTSGTMAGIISCPYVDTVGFRYLVCPGWVYEGQDMFVGGMRTTANLAFDFVTVNGRRFTVIDSAIDRGTSAITCNVLGYETAGDLSGTFISHPVDQLKHFLANWVFLTEWDPETGVWQTDMTDLPIDETSFTAAKAALADRAGGAEYVTGRWLTAENQAVSYLNEWCESMGVAPYWTTEGKLALYYDDPHEDTKRYSPDAMMRRGINAFDVKYLGGNELDVIRTQRATWASDGPVPGGTSARDLTAPGTDEDPLDIGWGALSDL